MVWCYNCTRHRPAQSGCSSSVCCNGCRKVVNQDTDSNAHNNSLQVAAAKCKNEFNILNAGKSVRFDVSKFKALRTVSKNAKGAVNGKGSNDSESLSNIDDAEIGSYLLKEDEKLFKKVIWERMNNEYTKAEAARKAAAANVMKLKKEKQQMQATEAKKTRGTAKTTNKRTSSRVNYDMLKELLGESKASDKSTKRRTDSYTEDGATSNQNESGHKKFTEWGVNVIDENYDDEGYSVKYQTDRYHDYDEEEYYSDDNGDDLF